MSVYETHGKTTTSPESVALQGSNRLLPRWLRSAIRAWQRRKMIALLSALDDRTLRDIGIHRGQIPQVVDRFEDHELLRRRRSRPSPRTTRFAKQHEWSASPTRSLETSLEL